MEMGVLRAWLRTSFVSKWVVELPTWGAKELQHSSPARMAYIAALKAADAKKLRTNHRLLEDLILPAQGSGPKAQGPRLLSAKIIPMRPRLSLLIPALALTAAANAQWADVKQIGRGGESTVASDGEGNVYITCHLPSSLYVSRDWGATFNRTIQFPRFPWGYVRACQTPRPCQHRLRKSPNQRHRKLVFR